MILFPNQIIISVNIFTFFINMIIIYLKTGNLRRLIKMKYFIINGELKNAELITDEIMKEHMAYTQKAMNEGFILMSGLKEDMSGAVFIMKTESIEQINIYLSNEPFQLHGIQEYRVIEFSPHYFNESPDKWFHK